MNPVTPQHPTPGTERAAWMKATVDAIAREAATGREFTTFDVAVRHELPQPGHQSWWGAATKLARQAGHIVPVATTTSGRKTVHASLVHTWRGRTTADDEAGAA